MKVRHFQRDHERIERGVAVLRRLVAYGVAAHAAEIAAQLLDMSEHIKSHLASEDRTLYPALAASSDLAIRVLAVRYQTEMGGLFEAFRRFVETWSTADRLEADPDGFRVDVDRVLQALHERLQREETEFFPSLEARLPAASHVSLR